MIFRNDLQLSCLQSLPASQCNRDKSPRCGTACRTSGIMFRSLGDCFLQHVRPVNQHSAKNQPLEIVSFNDRNQVTCLNVLFQFFNNFNNSVVRVKIKMKNKKQTNNTLKSIGDKNILMIKIWYLLKYKYLP